MASPNPSHPTSGRKPLTKPAATRTNSLGLSQAQLETVLSSIEAAGDGGVHSNRESSRHEFRNLSVDLDIAQMGGGHTRIRVACRNLSRTGIGFLHSSYMHTGTGVIVTLPHAKIGEVRIPGTVVRCRHVTRNIHDVGVKFKQPVDIRDFVQMDVFNQVFSIERVDPTRLSGVLLIVAEYRIDQACIQSMLRDTSLEFIKASTVEQGLAEAIKGVDIVICDYAFETSSGIEFVKQAKARGIRCPILIMSADQCTEARTAIAAAKAAGFIPKPIDQSTLQRALAEFLLLSETRDTDANRLFTTLPSNSPLIALSDDFVGDLKKTAEEIEKLVPVNDVEGVRKRVLRVVGAAPSLGFEPVSKLGNSFLKSLAETMSLEETLMPLNAFLSTCRAVRPSGAGEQPRVKSA